MGYSVLYEGVGLAIAGGLPFLAKQLFPIAPIDKSFSSDIDQFIFCAIPVACYLTYRFYFSLSLYVAGDILPSPLKPAETWIRRFLIIGGFAIACFVPGVRQTIKEVIDTYLTELFITVKELSMPELQRAYSFGVRVFGLIGGWFAALFCIELLLRAVLMLLVAVFRGIGLLPKKKIRIVKVKQKPAAEDEEDSDEDVEEEVGTEND